MSAASRAVGRVSWVWWRRAECVTGAAGAARLASGSRNGAPPLLACPAFGYLVDLAPAADCSEYLKQWLEYYQPYRELMKAGAQKKRAHGEGISRGAEYRRTEDRSRTGKSCISDRLTRADAELAHWYEQLWALHGMKKCARSAERSRSDYRPTGGQGGLSARYELNLLSAQQRCPGPRISIASGCRPAQRRQTRSDASSISLPPGETYFRRRRAEGRRQPRSD